MSYAIDWDGQGETWTREKVRGATVRKAGRKYQHSWLYLQSINSINNCRKVPLQDILFRWRHFALVFLYLFGNKSMVVYIYYITAAGNVINSHQGSCCQGSWYDTAKKAGMDRPSRTKSHPASSAAVLDQPSGLRPHWSCNACCDTVLLHLNCLLYSYLSSKNPCAIHVSVSAIFPYPRPRAILA